MKTELSFAPYKIPVSLSEQTKAHNKKDKKPGGPFGATQDP